MQSFGRTGLELFRVPFFTTRGEERVVEAYIHTQIYTQYACICKYKFKRKRRICEAQGRTKTKHCSCWEEHTFPKLVSHTLKITAVNILSPIKSPLHREELAIRSNGSHLHYGQYVPPISASSHHFMGSLTPAAVATAVLHMAPAALSTVPC